MYCHDKAYLSKREHNEEKKKCNAKRIIYTCLYHLCILFKWVRGKKASHIEITEKSGENSVRDKWDIETTKGKMRRTIFDMMQIFNFKLKIQDRKGRIPA